MAPRRPRRGGGNGGDGDATAATTANATTADATTPLLPSTIDDDPDAALERAFKPWPAVLAYCLAFLGFGAASNVLGPTVDALAARLPGGTTRAADLWVVFFTGGLVSTLGAVPSGWLIDLHPRVPGHRLLAVAMLSQSLGLLAIHRLPWASASLWGLVLCNAAVSLTLNLVNTGVNTYSLWSARRSGGGGAVLVNAVHLFFGAGALCAPLLVMLSTRLFGQPLAAFDLSAGIVALIAAVFWAVPSPPRPREAREEGREEDGAAANDEDEDDNEDGNGNGSPTAGLVRGTGSVSSSLADDQDAPAITNTPAFWSSPQGRLVLLLATAFTLLCVGMEVAVGGWSATFAREAGGQDAQAARGMNSLYWLSFTLGRLFASAAAAVTTPTQGLAASLPVLVLGAAVAIAGGGGGGAAQQAGGGIGKGRLAAALALFGLGYAPQFANVIAALDEVAPVPGWINGLLGGTASAGVMLVPPALGLAAASERLGLAWSVLPWSVVLATGLQAVLLAGQTAAVRVALRGVKARAKEAAAAAKRRTRRGGGGDADF